MKLMSLWLALSVAACFACSVQPQDLQAAAPGPGRANLELAASVAAQH